MAGFDILNIVGDPWNDAEAVFGGIEVAITDTASRADSKFLEFLLNGAPVYTVLKTGETYLSNPAGTSRGGMALAGASGEMGLTSQIDTNTGAGAHVLRYYWEDANHIGSDPDSVAVLRGMGNNRLSIESNGTMVHIANNGRYEFETQTYGTPIQFVGYEASGSSGVPIMFNNHNQTVYAESVVQVAVDVSTQIALQIGLWNNGSFSTTAYFDGSGGLYARSLSAYGATGVFRGVSTRVTGELTARVFQGLDRNDNGFIGFGTGNSALDAYIYRAGPNLFSIGGAAAPDRPAIKGIGTAIQGRLADDSDFCTVQGKLTTDQIAVSETITPDSTLTLYDAAGTAYKVPCVAA
ncbi:hypothetical protein OF829_19140 [Sphingomonas sp. LB-2]|uniref:hypothetical protein n=1 Tax=Sphingomonas caeni TaxID=2984949 RepID=UPI00222F6358|nr:hypothetical protein [Sphingomonas caeni]MCW3849360.1 hypothetical protein [Sphingomonas caeni]